jgi:hypothetical protein
MEWSTGQESNLRILALQTSTLPFVTGALVIGLFLFHRSIFGETMAKML